jgi:holo-[acyl-carrier protein] synthase
MIVGIGLDLVDIPRIARLLAAQGERAMARLFTEGEAEYARRAPGAGAAPRRALRRQGGDLQGARRLAGRPRHRWRDIEVATAWDGRPLLVLHGRARARAEALGVVRAHLTLTHADAVAGAMVVLESAADRPVDGSDAVAADGPAAG